MEMGVPSVRCHGTAWDRAGWRLDEVGLGWGLGIWGCIYM
jgi:hypothetical protein